ncbi:MAG: Cell envelope-related transcriptional attenuator [Candidatus Amesbacteria bacterium GW2011_GWA2_42_12]|uniref:Cell envelope-related transcriptional attenuator n=1 Tax=Candidatus Amesbacteria bacterium GW2011_GWA2_42_12 TaxID=1618356 RepID=A0A0G0Y946_9BACT|nr:MAG: Cell envelope-related transcriptional attenuator [Candidatus Amesbacteria bacterium GW2011_GWA2_42_12]
MALYQRIKRQFLSKTHLVRLVIGVGIVLGVFALWTWMLRPLYINLSRINQFLNIQLQQSQDRINFLLLGIGGGEHEGGDLTDTMILVSVNQTTGDVAMVSIPRDIWVPSMRAKVNTAYHYGEEKQPGGGFVLAKSAVSEIVGLPVHYAALINFANFEKFIDSIGGVDINVQTAFDDYKYPITGKENDLCDGDPQTKCRLEHLHFEQGVQHMSGNMALKYVRSRYAEGDEGTDFARSRRQQKLIMAIKDKLTAKDVITNPKKIKSIYETLIQSFTSDLGSDFYPALLKLGLKVDKSQIRTISISEDQLYNPPISAKYDYQWVLVPKDGSFDTLSTNIKNFLNNSR